MASPDEELQDNSVRGWLENVGRGLMRIVKYEREDQQDSRIEAEIIEAERTSASLEYTLPPMDYNWTWFNVAKPLTLDHFRRRLVILDFFTYCCVNCLHILPDLIWPHLKKHILPRDRVC